MNKPYLYKYEDPKAFELISQEGVQYCTPVDYPGFNCCWDANLSPDGEFYLALGSELGDAHYAHLNRYNREKNCIEDCFDTKDYVCTPGNAMLGSKLHSCINFMPDGRIICNNHNTAKAAHHPEWLPWSYRSHIWEGFEGSTIFIYDPKTGSVESRGIIAPHETMYAGIYCTKTNCYYTIGCLAGHLYRYSLDTREVKDYGKILENNCYWLHVGPDQNIYACSPNGFLLRLDTDTDKVEWTGHILKRHPSDPKKYQHERYVNSYIDLDDRRMLLYSGLCNHLYEYDTVSNELHDYGELFGADEFFEGMGNQMYSFSADLDSEGVLWYSVHPRPDYNEKYKCQTTPSRAFLFRWDYRNPDASPENMGVIGAPGEPGKSGLTIGLVSELKIDRKLDILYCVSASDVELGPPVFCIDLALQRKNFNTPRLEQSDDRYKPKPRDPKPPTVGAFEGASLENNHQAFESKDFNIVRLWTSARGDEYASAVRGLYWVNASTIRGVCGESKENLKYFFTIRGCDSNSPYLERLDLLTNLKEDERAELIAKSCPAVHELPDGVKLPHVSGRQYLAKPACDVDWNGGRRLIGTLDGKLALLDGTDVRSYGSMSECGGVRALAVNSTGTLAYGAAGHNQDISRVFTFDEKHGANDLGILLWKDPGIDKWVASDLISALSISPDDSRLAIGTEDWISCVYIVKI